MVLVNGKHRLEYTTLIQITGLTMTKHILVADDDLHIREVIRFALEKAGMQVTLAEDGRQALEQFRLHTVDLIVLDINMPEFDGLEVCREIRKSSDVPILSGVNGRLS